MLLVNGKQGPEGRLDDTMGIKSAQLTMWKILGGSHVVVLARLHDFRGEDSEEGARAHILKETQKPSSATHELGFSPESRNPTAKNVLRAAWSGRLTALSEQ